jgi:hypothetical protein
LSEIGPGVRAQFGIAALQGELTNECLKNRPGQQVFGGCLWALALAGCFTGGQAVSALGQSKDQGNGGSDSLQLHGRLSIEVLRDDRAEFAYWNA